MAEWSKASDSSSDPQLWGMGSNPIVDNFNFGINVSILIRTKYGGMSPLCCENVLVCISIWFKIKFMKSLHEDLFLTNWFINKHDCCK